MLQILSQYILHHLWHPNNHGCSNTAARLDYNLKCPMSVKYIL